MRERYLIFDIGASNGRAIVAESDGKTFAFNTVHRFENRPVFANDGEYFWDILRLFSEVKEGIRLAEKAGGPCKSMAIDTFGCDFGLIAEDGRLIGNPLNYRDESQHELSAELHGILSEEELFALSGGPCNRIMGIYKLYSLMRKNAVEYREGSQLLMIPEILNHFLTGKTVNEFTNATMTLLVNQKTRQWEPEILRRLGLRTDILKPLVEPGYRLGMLREQVCAEIGVTPIPVIVPATHDTASAVSGIPVTEPEKHWAYISLGTWCLAGLETDAPLMDSAIVKIQFGNEGGANGKNLLLKNITGLWVIQQCRIKWNKDAGEALHWDYIDELALESREQNAVIDLDDPLFGKVHADMPGIIAEYCRQTRQDVPATIGEVARCVFKSLALMFRRSFDEITAITRTPLELIHLVGGGTQSPLVCQWAANALGVRAIAGPTETTAVGNLIFQLMADGKIKSIEEGRKLCAGSSQLREYLPRDEAVWASHYKHYRKVIG